MSEPCHCHECVTAGCTEPPVTLGATNRHPQRELHGKELAAFYAQRDARRAFFKKLADDLIEKSGLRAQRGDEPR
jgi:hypothetical protein